MKIELGKQTCYVSNGQTIQKLGKVAIKCDLDTDYDRMRIYQDVLEEGVIATGEDGLIIEFTINDLNTGRPIRYGSSKERPHIPHTTFILKDGKTIMLEHTSWTQMHIFVHWVRKDSMYLDALITDLPCNISPIEFNNTVPGWYVAKQVGDDSTQRSTESAS